VATYHQSDVSSWARCAAQVGYRRAGLPEKTNSAAAYGSVMHHALQVLERDLCGGVPFEAALTHAVETFTWYWHPANIHAICEPVPEDGWLPNQGYSVLRSKGIETLRKYADLVRYDDKQLLATEFPFIVPLPGTWDDELGEPHYLAGAIDRLTAGAWRRLPTLFIEDFKTGKEYLNLRYNLQFSGYALASLQPEFWMGCRGEPGFGEKGEELYKRFDGAGRRGMWINLRSLKFQDAGWRGPVDYKRFTLAIEQMHASITADIFPLSISGENCRYCPHRSVCGGTGLPDEDHGKPGAAA
jgi:PD-(D/E)XK nuclease superfamily